MKGVVIAKPLAVATGKENLIEDFILKYGKILVKKRMVCNSYHIANHYAQFAGKPFFGKLVEYYTGRKIVVYLIEVDDFGPIREAMGPAKGTSGFRYALLGDMIQENLAKTGVLDNGLHCSDSKEEGEREMRVWFAPPTTSEQTKSICNAIYKRLQRLGADAVDIQYAGGEHDGTAVPGSKMDLDFRILSANIDKTALDIAAMFKTNVDKIAVDDQSGARYVKFELRWSSGKADIAVVPFEAYRHQVSKSHLIALAPDEMKARVRDIKAKAKKCGKARYTAVKRICRRYLLTAVIGETA